MRIDKPCRDGGGSGEVRSDSAARGLVFSLVTKDSEEVSFEARAK